MPLKIKPGAASLSYDLQRRGYTVATVWSGDRSPSEAVAQRNAAIMGAAFDMHDSLRAAVDRLEYLGDDPAMVRQLKAALPRLPEPGAR